MNFMTGIRVHLQSDRQPSGQSSDGGWILEGSRRGFSVGNRKLVVRYGRGTSYPSVFQIFLEKFTIGNDPGTTKAATYQSNVVVHDTSQGVSQKALISMNEPLKYGGYTFYQASYQLQENGPPVLPSSR